MDSNRLLLSVCVLKTIISSCSIQPAKRNSQFLLQFFYLRKCQLELKSGIFLDLCLHHLFSELWQQPKSSHLHQVSICYYYNIKVMVVLKYEASQLALLLFFKSAGHMLQGILICLFSARTACPQICTVGSLPFFTPLHVSHFLLVMTRFKLMTTLSHILFLLPPILFFFSVMIIRYILLLKLIYYLSPPLE